METCNHCGAPLKHRSIGRVDYLCGTWVSTGSQAATVTRSWACYQIAALKDYTKTLEAQNDRPSIQL